MIYEMLYEGEENARTAKELAYSLNMNTRNVSVLIEAERRAGYPICATCDAKHPGYYIPETWQDMESYCNRLLHRMGEIAKTRDACLQTRGRFTPANGGFPFIGGGVTNGTETAGAGGQR